PYTIRAIRGPASPLYTRPETAVERPEWNWPPMMHLLEAVVTEGTGRAARLDRRSAGKTGTTHEYRDAWFVGFTSDIVVGVWVGNDDNSPTDHVAGGEIPAKIWHDFVTQAERIIAKTRTPAPVPAVGAPTSRGPGDAATAPSAAIVPPTSAAPPPPAPAPPSAVQSAALTSPAPPQMRGV